MKYKFSKSLDMDYKPLAAFIKEEQELTKQEILERAAGHISYELLQQLKALEFDYIGRTADRALYIR